MIKPKKKKKNRYQESTKRRLKGYLRAFRGFSLFFAAFCFVVLLGAGLVRLYNTLLDSSWFRVEKIELTGLQKLDRVEVLDTMGIRRGECILNLRLGPAAERLRKLPMVRSASVRYESRGMIVAEIAEREPVAIVLCGETLMKMDADGILFAVAAPGESCSLPLMTGLCGQNVKPGDSAPVRSIEQIRNLFTAFENCRSWLSGTAINECRWGPNGFTLVLGERAVPVEIGKDNFEQKLIKLKKVITALSERQWIELVTRIDLDYPGKAFLEGQFPLPKPAQGTGRQPG